MILLISPFVSEETRLLIIFIDSSMFWKSISVILAEYKSLASSTNFLDKLRLFLTNKLFNTAISIKLLSIDNRFLCTRLFNVDLEVGKRNTVFNWFKVSPCAASVNNNRIFFILDGDATKFESRLLKLSSYIKQII